jgi:arginase
MEMVIIGVPDLQAGEAAYQTVEAWKNGGLIERIAPHVSRALWVTLPLPDVDASTTQRQALLTTQLMQAVHMTQSAGAVPLIVGGNRNTTSVGAVAGLGDEGAGVVWFDARDPWKSTPDGNPSPLMQLTQAGGPIEKPVKEWHTLVLGTREPPATGDYRTAWTTQDIAEAGADELGRDMKNWPPVYLHLDLSVLDPEIMPAVADPLPAGMDFDTLVAAIDAIAAGVHVAAIGVTNFALEADQNDLGLAVGLELLANAVRILAI